MPRHGTNIRKRADGRWEGRYKIPDSDSFCKYKSVYGKTRREVKEKLERIAARKDQPVPEDGRERANPEEEPENFASISIKWLENIKEIRKYSTYIKYRGIYERHIRDTIGGASVSDISCGFVNEKIFARSSEVRYLSKVSYLSEVSLQQGDRILIGVKASLQKEICGILQERGIRDYILPDEEQVLRPAGAFL